MFFEVRAPQDEAKIVPNRLSEPLSSDFGRAKSLEKPVERPIERLGAPKVAQGACRVGQVARARSRIPESSFANSNRD